MILFDKVAILGAGLLGGSLALALKDAKLCKRVSLWSRSESTRAKCAEKIRGCEVCREISEAVKDAGLIVLSSTVSSIPEVAKEAAKFAKKGAVAADVGSTKETIAKKCAAAFAKAGVAFVPSHPMAGLEKSGAEFAKKDLFSGAACFVCPSENKAATNAVKNMWEKLGMRVFFKTPKEHDKIAAKISHVPQCVSSALALSAAGDIGTFKKFAGNGFKDTTRIAKSDANMWKAILSQNPKNIAKGLDDISKKLGELSKAIKNSDEKYIEKFLSRAKDTRLKLEK
ncbi:MAG: prephenate dehydrogenase/arogenate dehydrogenase family protein [Opitutales bacterium]|nr:prephenate dehydrogenase/arogenate dehydrogenase family protein [Opitutales bacterium]